MVTVKTSGSTGTPKEMVVSKIKMEHSARITCNYLGLKQGDKALLCMPVTYIAGKMMIVRALIAGLELEIRKPDGHPFSDISAPMDFAALTPMQVYNSLQIPVEAERLKQTRILIIGGGAIDQRMEQELADFPNEVYSTYGMTETLSHIALRRLNGKDASQYYIPFPSARLSLSKEGTLIIDAPLVSDELLYTNDIVELLPDGRFKVLGRKDNVINSGGIKMQIEMLEDKIRPLLITGFAITTIPDAKFGEVIVLLTETIFEEEKLALYLSGYELPKHVLCVDKIPLTQTNKIDRASCKELAMHSIS
ncbi:AMP-binding protein [Bacteroides sp. 519]|uniref:AMP-binding protein n=1 Tax=Bacteroides sp. 519 TaxID=2302937 RepID=UPI00351A0770